MAGSLQVLHVDIVDVLLGESQTDRRCGKLYEVVVGLSVVPRASTISSSRVMRSSLSIIVFSTPVAIEDEAVQGTQPEPGALLRDHITAVGHTYYGLALAVHHQ